MKEKERKLTEAELKRKAEFEKLTEELAKEGYQPNHITIGVFAANILAIVAALPFIVLLVVAFCAFGHTLEVGRFTFLIAYGAFLLLIVVHELIHGITWACFAKDGWKSISFGFIKEYLTPYCTCNQPMRKYQMILGSMMPTIVLGFIPGIVAVMIGSTELLFIAILMIIGGGGDLLVTFKLLAYKRNGKDVLFIDHPYELGTAVFEKPFAK